mmetsp:Transcript_38634/g.70292  ORF Transcript_38634/g.70292 Transcript_38634/m.70292 type:complete len:210 (+) Transcript_38634:741-1370(+)
MDGAHSKHTHVGWLHKELVPSLLLDLLQDGGGLEAILYEDGWDHGHASLDELLHVLNLVVDPTGILPSWPHVHRLLSLDDRVHVLLVTAAQRTHYVVPHVEVDMVRSNPLRCHFTTLDEIHFKDVGMQSEHLHANGDIDMEHAAPAICVWVAGQIVVALVLLWVVSVLRSNGNRVMPLVANKPNADLGFCTTSRTFALYRVLPLLLHQG